MDRITDHVDQGLLLLLGQFKGKPRLEAWLTAYVRQCQVLEDAIYDVLIARMLDNAVGEQLDVIGRIVGELRQGNDDGDYLTFIKARIRINRSRGSTKDVLEVLNMITATSLIFTEFQPACLFIELLTIPTQDPVLLYGLLADTKAGGVKLTMISPTSDTRAARPLSSTAVHFAGSTGSVVTGPIFSVPTATWDATIVGASITISGAASSGNNGTFVVGTFIDSTHLHLVGGTPVPGDANNGTIVWSIYQGTRASSNPLFAIGDATDTSATLTCANAGPYALTDGMTLTMVVDSVDTLTFTFHTADFVAIGAATVVEVLAVLNRTRRRRQKATGTTHVTITTYRKGTATTLHVTGGTANAALGFSTTGVTGTGDVTFGLISDAVTRRDPTAAPEVAPPGPPFILFLDPPTGAP